MAPLLRKLSGTCPLCHAGSGLRCPDTLSHKRLAGRVHNRRMSVAVITGAGSGVGRAIAVKFVAEGWRRRPRRAARRRAGRDREAGRAGLGRAARRRFRATSAMPSSVSTMGEAVLERFGGVDVLVNSAGINVPKRSFEALSTRGLARRPRHQSPRRLLLRSRVSARHAARGAGTIININSDVGKVARDLAGPAYVSSKFGLMGLTAQINAEERSKGMRACSICPRDINTPLLDKRPQPPTAGSARADAAARRHCRVRLDGGHDAVAGRRRRNFVVDSLSYPHVREPP